MDNIRNFWKMLWNEHADSDNMLLKGISIFTHNPEIRKKEEHMKSCGRLNWNKERIKRALEMKKERLWLSTDKIKEIA